MSNKQFSGWTCDRQLVAKLAVGSGILAIICILASSSGAQVAVSHAQVRKTGKWSAGSNCAVPVRKAFEAAAAVAEEDGWHGYRSTVRKRTSKSPRGMLPDLRRPPGAVPSITPMLAIPTANIWAKTELLLHSLAVVPDRFELLVVDEFSRDGTPQQLAKLGVHVISPPKSLGVTYNWNLMYKTWMKSSHGALFIGNNDVLIPNGVLNAMTHAMTPEGGDCDLVCPVTTNAGKGAWANETGLEALFGLTGSAAEFVNNPVNYQYVQDILDEHGCNGVFETADIHSKAGFSGFFFGIRRSISRFAFDKKNLLNPKNRNIGQEMDIFGRMSKDNSSRICLHTGAFIYHYKASTITAWKQIVGGRGDVRESFRASTMELTTP